MPFLAIPPKSARLPKFRESEAVYKALNKQATKAGVTLAEAIRQLLGAYLANPFKLSPEALTEGPRDRHWAPVSAEPAFVQAITNAAQKSGVSVGEAIRQIVRNHLRSSK